MFERSAYRFAIADLANFEETFRRVNMTVRIVTREDIQHDLRFRSITGTNQLACDATATLSPFDGFQVDYTFEADHPVYNRYPKRARLDFSNTSYVEEVSRARSFGLVKELEQAQTINRCMGSSLENAVGIDDYEILNEDGLRYEDEFVKHKLLDVIGDLYLLGRPVLGRFHGHKSGHALNNKLARALLRCEDAWEVVTFGKDERLDPILAPAAL